MRKYFFLLLFATSVSYAQDINSHYQAYREGLLNNYQGFRKSVLDNYADFLEGAWTRYDAFRGKKRDSAPKPTVIPKAEQKPTPPAPVKVPTPDKPIEPVTPSVPVSPLVPPTPVAPVVSPMNFDYYGMSWRAPKVECIRVGGVEGQAIADVWRQYQTGKAKDVIPSLKTLAASNGLNDWFTFQMVRRYVDAVAAEKTGTDRMVLLHFLLTNMGYDIRLARTENQMLLLVPFAQQVYERGYMMMDGNKKFYVFYDEKEGQMEAKYLYSCELPKEAECGRVMNLLYNQQSNIRHGDVKKRTLMAAGMKVEGSVNVTLMEMLRHYPQMDIPEYARSVVDQTLHKSILVQLKPQIEGLSQKDAANKLLTFVQYAFDYATDGEQHGYEKAYFLEENFYYPKNDCEDRAIFYAFLVRNLLGLDVHLVHFPGHECTAVCFTDTSITGDAYQFENKRYVICDPTYIGASIGMCMPDYKSVKPEVELW